MCLNPSWPSVGRVPNPAAKTEVTGNAVGNSLITVSIQTHPLCLPERRGRAKHAKEAEKGRQISSFIGNESYLFRSKEKNAIHLFIRSHLLSKKKKEGKCHHSRLILEEVINKRLSMIPI